MNNGKMLLLCILWTFRLVYGIAFTSVIIEGYYNFFRKNGGLRRWSVL